MKKIVIIICYLIILASCSSSSSSKGFVYTVKKGDSLISICKKYGVSEEKIMYYNNKYFNYVDVGERLYIPVKQKITTKNQVKRKHNDSLSPKEYKTQRTSKGLIYRVEKGDNLYRISKNFSITVSRLKELNNLDSNLLAIDQELYIKRFSQKSSKTEKKHSQVVDKKRVVVKSEAKSKSKKATTFATNNRGKISNFPKEWLGKFILPLEGMLSSPFGNRHGGFHKGVDISAPPGTRIKAAYSGTVSYAGFLRDYGNIIIIDHGKNIVSVYAHNEMNMVKKSDRVDLGMVIARVGSTGRSTGPHLHFEIRVDNNPIDPAKIVKEIKSLKKI